MPSSKPTCREAGTVTIVDLKGLLMLGESSALFRQVIEELIEKRQCKVILNFRDVTSIDSAGVGELLAAYTAMKNRQGLLKLLNPPKKIRDMLEITQLSKVLEVYTEEEPALRSFS